MSTFSERYGYVVKPLQLESMTIELRNRIWNIYRCEICNDIAAVSYTHLDVYKRQGQGRRYLIAVHHGEDHLLLRRLQIGQPVSYTHLIPPFGPHLP